jgi:hypothetical protein
VGGGAGEFDLMIEAIPDVKRHRSPLNDRGHYVLHERLAVTCGKV